MIAVNGNDLIPTGRDMKELVVEKKFSECKNSFVYLKAGNCLQTLVDEVDEAIEPSNSSPDRMKKTDVFIGEAAPIKKKTPGKFILECCCDFFPRKEYTQLHSPISQSCIISSHHDEQSCFDDERAIDDTVM